MAVKICTSQEPLESLERLFERLDDRGYDAARVTGCTIFPSARHQFSFACGGDNVESQSVYSLMIDARHSSRPLLDGDLVGLSMKSGRRGLFMVFDLTPVQDMYEVYNTHAIFVAYEDRVKRAAPAAVMAPA